MDITSRNEDTATVLSLAGRADISNCHTLHREVRKACKQKPKSILVDFSNVEYADTSCVAVMVVAARKLHESGGKLVLAGASDKVRDTFRISELDGLWETIDSVENASGAGKQ